MNLHLTIECRHCAAKRHATVEFGEKNNDRVGVLAVYLPQGWEQRSEDATWLKGIAVRFICAKCVKLEKAKRDLEAADREAEIVDSEVGMVGSIEHDNFVPSELEGNPSVEP